jgi:hypothetical protein
MTGAQILTALAPVDGAGSGLDADLLDGLSSAAFSPVAHTHSYSSLTGIPSTFAPSAHGHAESEITNLVSDLAGKAPTVHSHAQSDVTGLVAALAAKEPTITAGNNGQYWRGDKSWVAFPTIPADDVIGGIITIASTAPVSPAVGDVWIDTN